MIWAAGKAGWYEISPSDRYLPHYNDTIEAIDLFYFMVDQHQKLPKKRQRTGFMVDPFLTEYQKHTGYRINDDDEAMETIHKHHRFLLKQMIEEREGVDWSETHLWNHLAETYAEQVQLLRATIAHFETNLNPPQGDKDSTPTSSPTQVDEESEEELDDQGEDEESETTRDSNDKSSSDSEDSDDDAIHEDWTKTTWDLLNILRKSPNFNMRECGIFRLATELQKSPSFPHDHKAAQKAIQRSASSLLRLMNEAKLRKKFNWSTRAIYDELEATLANEVANDTMETPAAGNADNQKHRMKSVLRPSGAGKARKRTRGVMDSQDEDEEMINQPISSPVARRNPPPPAQLARRVRELTVDSAASREDSPSRQLNGHYDPHALPELPPGPEAQEMLDLVEKESKRVGRHHQMSHLQAFLEQMVAD